MADSSPDFIPDSSVPIAPTQSSSVPTEAPSFLPSSSISDEDKYGSLGQQVKTGLEGAAQGVVGPLAPLAETKLLGVKPEDIRMRAEINPVAHGLSEAAGFAGSLATGVGEAGLIGKIGEGAQTLAGLNKLGEGAKVISKIAAAGIKSSAEMAALQTSDELSKAITQDPGQTLGSAAINIGLSGIIGGAGGAVLGSVSPLWKTATNKIGVEKLANDFMGETQFLRDNPDLVQGATNEVSGRMAETEDMLKKVGNLKGNAIAKTLPEATPENVAKIDSHLQEIADIGAKKIEDASKNSYLKSSVPRLAQDHQDFLEAITNPDATLQTKWDALNDYKQATQGHANYNILTGGADEKAVSRWIKPFAASLRESLEDTKVWGEAGQVQKTVNGALSDLFTAQKDFIPKITSSEAGERIADPTKIQTLLNQANKGKGALRVNAVNNYLEATQKAADAINSVHIENGLESPLSSKFNPTPVLDRSLNTPLSPGRNLAQWANAKGAGVLANATGETVAGAIGGLGGFLVGHPIAGAYVGERILGPVLSGLAKPFAENAVNSEAMRATVDYAANAVKGTMTLNSATKNLFKAGAQILPENLMPSEDSRARLQKSLDHISDNPQNMMNVSGNIGHYLPDHATAATYMASTAQDYLMGIKPKQTINSPLDTPSPVNKIKQNQYNRQLDIAQQPLMVLEHIKNGTLQAQDIKTLNTLYPSLHSQLTAKVQESMLHSVGEGNTIPYKYRLGLGMLLGQPLDTTSTVQGMQSIIKSASSQQSQQQMPAKHNNSKASGTELNQINKVNSLYQTSLQARTANRNK